MLNDTSSTVRPDHERRLNYEPTGPSEEFIVPLLKDRINDCLLKYGRHIQSPPRVLDAGCGRQPFRQALVKSGFRYTSMDVTQSPENCVDILCAIDEPMSSQVLANGLFDLILCTEVLEHVADWAQAFKNISMLLAPGGRILITAPHVYILHEEPYDFWRPTPYALEYFARVNALKPVHVEKAGGGWEVLGTLMSVMYFMPESTKFLDRLLARVFREARKLLMWSLKRNVAKRVRAGGPWYLCNVVVLEKQ